MYLKKIELFGFKSFPKKQDIKLHPGITVFVGPNGCGKSNVIEAVRWALGEQSAKELRSSRMDDVIFDGSDRLKRFNTAEVSLTFSNEGELPLSFSEVVISRRITRTGKKDEDGREGVVNTYMINRRQVRLRDVKDILLSMGIASTNYMLFQKETIDRITNSGNKEIRNIIEEGADIAKYKEKKEESLKKLNSILNEVAKIEYILKTHEEELERLKVEADKAREREKVEESIKETEKLLFAVKRKKIFEEMDRISAEREKIDNRRNEVSDEFMKVEEEIEKYEDELKDVKNEITSVEIEIESLQSEIGSLNEKIKDTEGYLRGMSGNEEIVSANISKLQDDIDRSNEAIKRITNEIASINEEISKLKNDIETLASPVMDELDEKNKEYRALLEEVSSLESRLLRLESEKNSIDVQKESVENNINDLKSSIEDLENSLDELESDKSAKEEELTVYENKIEDISDRIGEIGLEKKNLLEKRKSLEKAISSLESEINSLRNKINRLSIAINSNIPNSLKEYIDDNRIINLWDHVKIKDEYKNIFFSLKSVFKDVFVIDEYPNIDNSDIPLFFVKDALKVENNIAFIIDKYDDERILKFFESIHYVDDAKNTGGGIAIDKNGNMNIYGIYVKGGKFEDIQATSLKLKELEEELKKKEKELNSKKEELSQNNDLIRSIEDEYSSLVDEKDETARTIMMIESDINEIKRDIDRIILEKKRLEKSIEDNERKLASMEDKIEKIENDINSIIKDKEEKENRIKQLEERLKEISVYEEDRKHLYEKKSKLQQLEERLKTKNEEKAMHERDIKQKTKDIEEAKKRFKEFHEERMRLLTEKSNHEKIKEEKEEELSVLREKYNVLRNRREDIESVLLELKEKRNQLDRELVDLVNERKNLSREAENYRQELEKIKNDLDELYYMSVDELPEPGDDSVEKVENRLKRLKNKLDRMGEVNMLAAKQYAEKESVVQEYRDQINDLLQSKENIEKTIEMVDKEATTRFLHYFYKVQEKFQEVFERLLAGEGDLVLTDPKNPLECEIELRVSPKGKKTKQLIRLSTGERTLMILSLLFAVYLVRPAPLCIMDEVDAPLDDANVERFIQLIKELSAKSQFLIVTHNKRTMEAADYIFGVTMDEPGVTTIYSWSMKDVEEKLKDKKNA